MTAEELAALEQGTPAWRQARVGLVTASRVSDIVAKTKSGPAASRMNYMAELICERLTGVAAEGFRNGVMDRGNEVEPQARAAYAFYHDDQPITRVGLILHPTITESGASPDSYVGTDGQLEIKCPNTATHIDTVLNEKIPGAYLTQMQWQMACSQRAWCDYVSFDPRLPEDLRLFIKRVPRDDMVITSLQVEVRAFLAELGQKMAALAAKVAARTAA